MADPTFAVVTDSGADIPESYVKELGIRVVPLSIHFGDEVFKDGVTLSAEAFYRRLVSDKAHLPHTSQPSPGDFQEVYEALAREGVRQVLSIHLSSKMSGTIQAATIAAREMEQMEIAVVDSRMASMGIGMLAIHAARLARQGRSLQEAVAEVEALREKFHVVFAVDTLEYLARNGRIGRAQSFLGGLLSIKPVLTLTDGVVAPVERMRGKNRALQELVDRTVAFLGDRPGWISVVHSEAPDEAESVRARIAERCQLKESILTHLGATIGTHVGPGTIGVLALHV
ncbi:MAG TPA: DegV family protein [Limnochorda sp.]